MQDDQFSNFLDFGIKNYLSKILVWIHLQEKNSATTQTSGHPTYTDLVKYQTEIQA